MAAKRQLSDRQRSYALLGMARRALGWDESQYRAHLRAHGASDHQGRPSASTMTFAKIEAALAAMEAAGWPRQAPVEGSILHRCHPARRAQWRKVCALWCALADAGQIGIAPNRPCWCGVGPCCARIGWSGPGPAACRGALKGSRTGPPGLALAWRHDGTP